MPISLPVFTLEGSGKNRFCRDTSFQFHGAELLFSRRGLAQDFPRHLMV